MNATLEYAGRLVTFLDVQEQDCIEGALARGQWYESQLLEFIRGLQVGGAYADVGAYVGTFSLFTSLFCPADLVYAIEPQADIYEKLENNLCANEVLNCVTYNAALSDSCGLGHMSESSKTNRGGAVLGAGSDVDVVTLDSLGLVDVRLLKIDAENHELAVLRGARDTIARGVDHVFVETWPEQTCRRYGVPYHGEDIADLMRCMGFKHQPQILADDTHYWKRATA